MACNVKLVNESIDKRGIVLSEEWALMDGDREFGTMHWNMSWSKQFQVMLYSPLGKAFGVTGVMQFSDNKEALAYADANMDHNKTYTLAMVEDQLAMLEESYSQETAADDYFYTNGRAKAYDSMRSELMRLKSEVESKVSG